jgi:hypothetical protein
MCTMNADITHGAKLPLPTRYTTGEKKNPPRDCTTRWLEELGAGGPSCGRERLSGRRRGLELGAIQGPIVSVILQIRFDDGTMQ